MRTLTRPGFFAYAQNDKKHHDYSIMGCTVHIKVCHSEVCRRIFGVAAILYRQTTAHFFTKWIMFNIVLVEPEIPQNTGNISRTCACTSTRLHIVKPMGFEITDAKLKRAGLEYWDKLDLTYYDDLDAFFKANAGARMFFLSKKAKNRYTDVQFRDGDFLVFGKETKGLPESLVIGNDSALRIPMANGLRSLNLSNTVALVLYEALRQTGFQGLV